MLFGLPEIPLLHVIYLYEASPVKDEKDTIRVNQKALMIYPSVIEVLSVVTYIYCSTSRVIQPRNINSGTPIKNVWWIALPVI